MNGGMCLTSGSTVTLSPCEASKASAQQWALEKNGNLHLTSDKNSCLALKGGCGPALVTAGCKTGPGGLNEMYTLNNGQLCSETLGSPPTHVCLKSENSEPAGGCSGGGGGADGFNCVANAAALARCQVHFTMWTIMKA
jgi:hypothetical protein